MRKTVIALAVSGSLVTFSACSNPQAAAKKHVERGDQYLAQNKPAEAILQYRNAIDKDPQLGEARKKLGLAQLKAGNARQALNQLVRAADLLPEDSEAQLAAGRLLLQARRFEDARARAENVLARDSKNVDGHILKANALAGLKDLDAAVDELEEAVSLDPGRAVSYAHLGAMEAVRGRHEEAEAAYLKAIEMAPNAVEPQLAIANYYFATRRRPEAENALKAALRIDPKNVPANRALAMLNLMAGNIDGAEAHLKTVVENTTDAGPRLTLADFYVSQKRPQDATPLLQELAGRKDSFGAATSRLAAIAYSKDRSKAYEMLDSVLAREPRNVHVLYVKGTWLALERRFDEGARIADTILKAAPESVQGHFLAGTVLAGQGKPSEAIAEFQEVIKRNPKALSAQLQLARLHEATGNYQSAKQSAQDAVNLAPRSGPARYALIRSLIASGDIAAAERELAPLAPRDSYEVQLSLGRIALARRDYAAAAKAMEAAVAAQPTGIEALTVLVGLEARNKRFQRAQELVRNALDKKPQDPSLLVLSARLDASNGLLPSAEATLRRVIESSPDYLPSYEVLGRLYIRQKNLDAARQEFERLAARSPKAVGPLTMVAVLHHAQGRSNDARAAYQRVLELDSRAVVANNNLAYIYAEEGKDLDLALQMAQAAKAASPDDPDVNDTLGWVYYRHDMATHAIGPLLQSTRINPDKPIYHYHLGLAYQKTGERDKAKAALERALSLGKFAEADAARKALDSLR